MKIKTFCGSLVTCVAISLDCSQLVYVVDDENIVYIWDIINDKLIQQIKLSVETIPRSLEISNNKKLIAYMTGTNVYLYNINQNYKAYFKYLNQERYRLLDDSIHIMQFTNNNQFLILLTTGKGRLLFVNLHTKKIAYALVNPSYISCFQAIEDLNRKNYLIVQSQHNGIISLRESQNSKYSIKAHKHCEQITINEDQNIIVTIGDGIFKIWLTKELKLRNPKPHLVLKSFELPMNSFLGFSSSTEFLMCRQGSNSIWKYDLEKQQLKENKDLDCTIQSMYVIAKKQKILIVHKFDRKLSLQNIILLTI